MTIRNAIILCETDNNCAGFTYKGAIWDLDEIYDVYFFKWVHILFLHSIQFGVKNMSLLSKNLDKLYSIKTK